IWQGRPSTEPAFGKNDHAEKASANSSIGHHGRLKEPLLRSCGHWSRPLRPFSRRASQGGQGRNNGLRRSHVVLAAKYAEGDETSVAVAGDAHSRSEGSTFPGRL